MPSVQYTAEGVIVRRLTTGSAMKVCLSTSFMCMAPSRHILPAAAPAGLHQHALVRRFRLVCTYGLAPGPFSYTQVVSGPEPGQLLLLDLQSKALFELQTGLETQVSVGQRWLHVQRQP